MAITDTDKMVAATLAAAKASAAKLEKPVQYVMEYERILAVMERRSDSKTKKASADEPV